MKFRLLTSHRRLGWLTWPIRVSSVTSEGQDRRSIFRHNITLAIDVLEPKDGRSFAARTLLLKFELVDARLILLLPTELAEAIVVLVSHHAAAIHAFILEGGAAHSIRVQLLVQSLHSSDRSILPRLRIEVQVTVHAVLARRSDRLVRRAHLLREGDGFVH